MLKAMLVFLILLFSAIFVFKEVPAFETISLSEVHRLTFTSYPEVHPELVVDKKGNIGVFWLSLKLRTPGIEGGWLDNGNFIKIRSSYSCVGRWDVAAAGERELWLLRTHWGMLYLHRLKNLREIKSWRIARKGTGDPFVKTVNGKPFFLWRKKKNSQQEMLKIGFFREEKPESLSLITTRKIRFPELYLRDSQFFVTFQTKKENWHLWIAKFGYPEISQIDIKKLPFSSTRLMRASGLIDSRGNFWVSWQEGDEEKEKIFLSFSPDMENWSPPCSVYPFKGRVVNPRIKESGRSILIFYQLRDEEKEEWFIKVTGTSREIFPQGKILGFDPLLKCDEFDIILLNATIWIAWQEKGDIFLGRGLFNYKA